MEDNGNTNEISIRLTEDELFEVRVALELASSMKLLNSVKLKRKGAMKLAQANIEEAKVMNEINMKIVSQEK